MVSKDKGLESAVGIVAALVMVAIIGTIGISIADTTVTESALQTVDVPAINNLTFFSTPADGDTFSINSVTFELDNANNGVSAGHVDVNTSKNITADAVVSALSTAISSNATTSTLVTPTILSPVTVNNTGLVGYWKFDENNTGTATGNLTYDSSGTGNNGTIYTTGSLSNSSNLTLTTTELNHEISLPSYDSITSASVTVYYDNQSTVSGTVLDLSINGNYIGNTTLLAGVNNYVFSSIESNLVSGATNTFAYNLSTGAGTGFVNVTQTTLTYTHTPTWTNVAKYGSALQFDGVNDYVDAGNDASLIQNFSAITVTAWVKPKIPQDKVVVTNRDGGDAGFTLMTITGLYIWGSDLTEAGSGLITLEPNEWQMLVGVYDSSLSTNNIKLYINGVLETTGNLASQATLGTGNFLSIGSRYGSDQFLNGTIDEVRIYNRALSADEIKTHYALYNRSLQLSAPDASGNSITTTETSAFASWLTPTLTGGLTVSPVAGMQADFLSAGETGAGFIVILIIAFIGSMAIGYFYMFKK